MNDTQIVSVIMPVYNSEQYVSMAIDSVLRQTYQNLELIIISDCPTDGTMDVVNAYYDPRIRVISHEHNTGVSYSRNQGIDEAEGEYLIFMDHDDIIPSNRISSHITYLQSHPEIDALGGKIVAIDENSNFTSMHFAGIDPNPRYVRAYMMNHSVLINSSVTYRTQFLKDHKLRVVDNAYGLEDYIFVTDVSRAGSVSLLNEVSLWYRFHTTNTLGKIKENDFSNRLKKWRWLYERMYQSEGYELEGSDYDTLVDIFSDKRTVPFLTIEQFGSLLTTFAHIEKEALRLRVDYYDELIRRHTEIKNSFAAYDPPYCYIGPFSPGQIIRFVNKYDNVYIYGRGKNGKLITAFLKSIGVTPKGYIISDEEADMTDTYTAEDVELYDSDGVIVSLNRKNWFEAKKIIMEKWSVDRLLIGAYE